MEVVEALVREVSESVIEPRFAALGKGDVEEKSVGEIVTVADREAEVLITTRLEEILPGVPVVGEEGCAADPVRLTALDADRAWVVDPLDGTANFVAGSPDWAVMVALVANGEVAASWIWQPVARRMYVAERGRRVLQRVGYTHRDETRGIEATAWCGSVRLPRCGDCCGRHRQPRPLRWHQQRATPCGRRIPVADRGPRGLRAVLEDASLGSRSRCASGRGSRRHCPPAGRLALQPDRRRGRPAGRRGRHHLEHRPRTARLRRSALCQA